MEPLSVAGRQAVEEIAKHHGFSLEAAMVMLESLVKGNGAMAQFDHPEFGGAGQWMRGGMGMLSDMFNNHLKARVDELCDELSKLLARQPDLAMSAVTPAPPGQPPGPWWPAELGQPPGRLTVPAQARPMADLLETIEKLADLRAKGILSDEEFSAKKADLLSRI